MITNNANIKVVVTDLDGTLLNPQHQISEFTKSVFKKLHDNNFLIIVATGRHHLDALSLIETLEIPVYLVSSNGARIHSPNKEVLFSYNIDADIVKRALDLEIDPEITMVLFKENVWQTNKTDERLNAFQADMKYKPEIVDYSTLEDFESIKIFCSHDDHDTLVTLKDQILAQAGNDLHHAFSLPTCLEFMAKGVDKAVAIKKVIALEGYTPEQALSFGDGFNDLQMLKLIGTGLIMGNAPDALKKQLSNLQIIGTSAQDGVAQYLAEHVLNMNKNFKSEAVI